MKLEVGLGGDSAIFFFNAQVIGTYRQAQSPSRVRAKHFLSSPPVNLTPQSNQGIPSFVETSVRSNGHVTLGAGFLNSTALVVA